MEKIISIDPGYDRCGVAIIENSQSPLVIFSECIQTDKKDTHEMRLLFIYKRLEELIKKYQPHFLALETIFFSVNKKTVIKVSEARGVCVLIAGIHKLELIELSPQEVKIATTGVGNADKKQVQKMVEKILKVDITGKIDDEIDAISLGLAATGIIKIKRLAK